jgi:hypothetical protein
MIDWNKISKEDMEKVHKIVDRVFKEWPDIVGVDRTSLEMDVTAAHINAPIDLDKLLGFPAADFGHDVFGISRYIDRNTGILSSKFFPRSSAS